MDKRFSVLIITENRNRKSTEDWLSSKHSWMNDKDVPKEELDAEFEEGNICLIYQRFNLCTIY